MLKLLKKIFSRKQIGVIEFIGQDNPSTFVSKPDDKLTKKVLDEMIKSLYPKNKYLKKGIDAQKVENFNHNLMLDKMRRTLNPGLKAKNPKKPTKIEELTDLIQDIEKKIGALRARKVQMNCFVSGLMINEEIIKLNVWLKRFKEDRGKLILKRMRPRMIDSIQKKKFRSPYGYIRPDEKIHMAYDFGEGKDEMIHSVWGVSDQGMRLIHQDKKPYSGMNLT